MKFTIATVLSVGTLAVAAPTNRRQIPEPDTVYGVDPSQSFYLNAATHDGLTGYILQPFYVDYLQGVLGLQAVEENGDGTSSASSPQANFTLTGSHYGTQLYAYEAGPCTSAAGNCDPSLLQWNNNEPNANSLLTFKLHVVEPAYGGLAFYGQYLGGDPEAGELNYLIGAGDTDLTNSFTVCDWDANPSVQIIAYQGTNSSCVPVTVTAVQTGGAF